MPITSNRFTLCAFLMSFPLAVGCGKKDATTVSPMTVAAGDAYTNEEVISLASQLVRELEMPSDKQVKVLKKLEKVLDDPSYRPALHKRAHQRGVTGVVAYRLGEGGAVVTVKSGKAVARLKGETASIRFSLSGADVGAQLAASREWGVGLVLGLPEGTPLEGSYRGTQKSATAGSGAGTVVMSAKKGGQELLLLGSGTGVSLDVSGATLKIKRAKA